MLLGRCTKAGHSARQFSTAIQHDVVVIGGGIVGATQACLLAGKVGSVCLVDPAPPNVAFPLPKEPDLRVISVNPTSVDNLIKAGAWPLARSAEFRNMHVWDTNGGKISFSADERTTTPLGHIVEMRLLTHSLHQALHARGVKVYTTEAVSLGPLGNAPLSEQGLVTLKDGTAIQSHLIIGADGGRSVVRTHTAPPTTGWSYSQLGVVATVQHLPHEKNDIAWQCFLPSGPIALLPLYGNYSSIVWSTNIAHAEYLMALDDVAFAHQVQQAFAISTSSPKLISVSSPSLLMPHIESVIGKRGAFPLKFEHAHSYVGPRVALVGDAAHVTHPLAGQGVNLGLSDAAMLAAVVIEAAENGVDIGSSQTLRKYERRQIIPNHAVMMGLDIIKHAFGQSSVLSSLRTAALYGLDHVPLLKNLFANVAKGRPQ